MLLYVFPVEYMATENIILAKEQSHLWHISSKAA